MLIMTCIFLNTRSSKHFLSADFKLDINVSRDPRKVDIECRRGD